MVGRKTLDLAIEVRILEREFYLIRCRLYFCYFYTIKNCKFTGYYLYKNHPIEQMLFDLSLKPVNKASKKI